MSTIQSNVQSWASYYSQHGLIIVNLPPQSKRPRTKDWQKKTSIDNPDTINQLQPQSNVGILLGSVSNNCVDVDLDCDKAIEFAPYFLPPTSTFGRASAPMSHYVYRTSDSPDFITAKHTDIPLPKGDGKRSVGGMIVELRASGGLQTVFPSSIHEGTGEVIDWTDNNKGDPLGLTTTIGSEELSRAVRKVAAMVIINEHVVSGVLHHASLYIIGALHGMGWNEIETTQFIDVMVEVCEMNYEGEIDRMKMIYEHYHTDRHTDGGFGILAQNIDPLAANKLRDLLSTTAYNDRKVERADQVFDAINPTGTNQPNVSQMTPPNLSVPNPPLQTTNLPPPITSVSQVNAPPAGLLGEGSASGFGANVDEFGHVTQELFMTDVFIKSTDFIATVDNPGKLDFLVNDFLVKGEVGLLVAPGSAKKTYVALDLACSLAYKDSWAGVEHPNNEPTQVLYIAGEGEDVIKQRTTLWHQDNRGEAKYGGGQGELFHYSRVFDMNPEAVSLSAPKRPKPGAGQQAWQVYNQEMETIGQRDDIAELEGLLQQAQDYNEPISLIIIDTLSSCYSGNENDSATVSAVIQRLKSMAASFNCTIMLVHHTAKQSNDYRGSTAWKNNSDFYFELKPEEKELMQGQQQAAKPEDREYTGNVVLTDPRQKKLPSNENAFVFKGRVEIVENYTNNKSKGDTAVRDIVLDLVDRKEEVVPVASSYVKKSKEGIDSLVKSQRDTFDYVGPLIVNKVGSGTEGIHIKDLYQAAKEYRANCGQKAPGTLDNFGRKLDDLARAKVIIITRKGGGEWIQIGEKRFTQPGYTQDISPIKHTPNPSKDRVEDVFEVIPTTNKVNTNDNVVNTNSYSFLD